MWQIFRIHVHINMNWIVQIYIKVMIYGIEVYFPYKKKIKMSQRNKIISDH